MCGITAPYAAPSASASAAASPTDYDAAAGFAAAAADDGATGSVGVGGGVVPAAGDLLASRSYHLGGDIGGAEG